MNPTKTSSTAKSATQELQDSLDSYGAPVPGPFDAERGQEVYAPVGGSFEAPAKVFVPGPYYMGVEEVRPELGERTESDADSTDSNGMVAKARESLKGIADKFPLDRRDFMKMFSASTMAATTSCLRRPAEKAIPYVNQPVDQFPGEAVYYATTCGECASGCGVLVRTREGRPTKLEGLPGHPINNGKLCGTGQASLQGLYHPERTQGPKIRFGNRMDSVSWEDVYEHLGSRMGKYTKIGILASGSTGHRSAFFREFLTAIGANPEQVYTYDSNSLPDAIAAAHKTAYGVEVMPRFDLMNAKLIVGVGADFLDVGVSVIYQSMKYTESHAFKAGSMGRHVQFETAMTMTGSRADERHIIAPGSETVVTLLLVEALLAQGGAKASASTRANIEAALKQNESLLSGAHERLGIDKSVFEKLAADMLATSSVVVCGGSHSFDENATALQLAAIMANELIGAYGNVLQLEKGWMPAASKSGDLQRFLKDAETLEVLFVVDNNPAFSLPPSFGVDALLKKIPIVVSMQAHPNETDSYATYVLPNNHYLESWGDEQPVAGFWTARQPAVRSTSNSRQAEEVMMWVAASMKKPMGYADYRAFMEKKWKSVHQLMGGESDFDTFFQVVLHQGYVGKPESQKLAGFGSVASAFKVQDMGTGLKLIAPLDARLGDGKHAHKPVLQESADALTTITWDSWVALAPATAAKMGFKRNDVLRVEGPAGSFEAALYVLPGLHADAVVVPRGNGHVKSEFVGTVEGNNGVNPLVAIAQAVDPISGAIVTAGQPVKLVRTGAVYELAAMQKHNDIANRKDIVKKISLSKAAADMNKSKDLDTFPDLYPKLPEKEHRWGMAIDLSRCTGCNACYVACSTENNVPQVGREQILMGREMHWIRMDRYFYGSPDAPQVTFQPMLCQHCNHAPCEAVCPVFATTHDPEGINAMTYNRCIGTRYCANACPYKIRRFNWWTHKWGVMGERLVDRNPRALNPDVTVRTRGVMEKCNFCYQRLRDAKHRSKLRGTPLADGEVMTACQQTCPTNAITFGNLHDQGSQIAALRKDNRAYLALGGSPEHGEFGIKTWPNVSYLAEVSLAEIPEEEEGAGHGAEGQEASGHGASTEATGHAAEGQEAEGHR